MNGGIVSMGTYCSGFMEIIKKTLSPPGKRLNPPLPPFLPLVRIHVAYTHKHRAALETFNKLFKRLVPTE